MILTKDVTCSALYAESISNTNSFSFLSACFAFSSMRKSLFVERKFSRSYLPTFNISKARKSLPAFLSSRCTPINLFREVCMPNLPRSEPIHFLSSFSATARVVPEPQKKSAIRSPSLLVALMIRSSNASGF